MDQNGNLGIISDHRQPRGDVAGAAPPSAAGHARLIAEVKGIFEQRAASTAPLARQKQNQLRELMLACDRPLALARSFIGRGGTQATPELAALETETAAVLDEARRILTWLHWLERRSASHTLWTCIGGTAGAGKGTFLGSATGVPGVVPSRGGKPVSAVTVRIAHDPATTSRRATFALHDGTDHALQGNEIDDWIAQHDGSGQELRRYLGIKDAEIRVAFQNPLAEPFTFMDTAGVIDGRDDEQQQLRDAIELQCDALLIIDRPLPDDHRELLTPANHLAYDFMARIPSFVVVNRSAVNGGNCERRRAELIARGIPADRILTADCKNITEVNNVLVTVLEWFLAAERQHRDA